MHRIAIFARKAQDLSSGTWLGGCAESDLDRDDIDGGAEDDPTLARVHRYRGELLALVVLSDENAGVQGPQAAGGEVEAPPSGHGMPGSGSRVAIARQSASQGRLATPAVAFDPPRLSARIGTEHRKGSTPPRSTRHPVPTARRLVRSVSELHRSKEVHQADSLPSGSSSNASTLNRKG